MLCEEVGFLETFNILMVLHFFSLSAKPGDLRSICIEKTSEPLGIQISCGEGGGIFVSSVTKNSLADQAGLQIGDHLLEVLHHNLCLLYLVENTFAGSILIFNIL